MILSLMQAASHHGYLTEICQNYDRDRHTLLDATRIEQDKVKEESTNQLEHLRTLIYAVYENSLRSSRNDYEAYLKRNDEITSTVRQVLLLTLLLLLKQLLLTIIINNLKTV